MTNQYNFDTMVLSYDTALEMRLNVANNNRFIGMSEQKQAYDVVARVMYGG